jgi:hypothetical protein
MPNRKHLSLVVDASGQRTRFRRDKRMAVRCGGGSWLVGKSTNGREKVVLGGGLLDPTPSGTVSGHHRLVLERWWSRWSAKEQTRVVGSTDQTEGEGGDGGDGLKKVVEGLVADRFCSPEVCTKTTTMVMKVLGDCLADRR